MKGIILAGGSGTRLYPLTKTISKQLLPVYDKPMVYYPLSVLMLAGIREILIISTPQDIGKFENLLGDGSDLGLELSYEEQPSPDGLAQAFIIAESFIGDDNVCLILGDNIFHGSGLGALLKGAINIVETQNRAVVFGNKVKDPERYGVAEFDENGKVKSIEEKPLKAKSNYAIVGLYFYPNSVIEIAKNVKPSKRGELEISSVNESFLEIDMLNLMKLGRGYAWLDTGTHESLLEASNYIQVIENRQGLKVACIEEIAFRNGWMNEENLRAVAMPMSKNDYGKYLLNLIKTNE